MPPATTRLPARKLSVTEEELSGTRFPFLKTFRPECGQNVQKRPAISRQSRRQFAFRSAGAAIGIRHLRDTVMQLQRFVTLGLVVRITLCRGGPGKGQGKRRRLGVCSS